MEDTVHNHTINVRADWDEEAHVWVATTDDVDGLAVEAETFEALKEEVFSALRDLVELNGFNKSAGMPEIPVHFMAEQLARIPNPCN